MKDLTTARLSLPLLALAQAQKELVHNEALALIDMLVDPVIEAVADDPASLSPKAGQCWLIGKAPSGEWADRADQLAGWTGAGWRYAMPSIGMRVTKAANAATLFYRDGTWTEAPSVAAPEGGQIIDAEARDSIRSIFDALRRAGLVLP